MRGASALAGFIGARSPRFVEWDLLQISTLRRHIVLSPRRWSAWGAWRSAICVFFFPTDGVIRARAMFAAEEAVRNRGLYGAGWR
jgi:hypothetical protein